MPLSSHGSFKLDSSIISNGATAYQGARENKISAKQTVNNMTDDATSNSLGKNHIYRKEHMTASRVGSSIQGAQSANLNNEVVSNVETEKSRRVFKTHVTQKHEA